MVIHTTNWRDGDQGYLPISQEVLNTLRWAASEEEAGRWPISRSVDLLREQGALSAKLTLSPRGMAHLLMRIASVNLSLGRLLEGHINALRLIDLYGGPELRQTVAAQTDSGAVLGVWGADGSTPVVPATEAGELSGAKIFASGLGTVSHALITVRLPQGLRLALVDVTDESRADASIWNMVGMRASASGGYDFTGLSANDYQWVGEAGDYDREPHFLGGVWRVAALQTGASIGLLDEAATKLRGCGRMDAAAQKIRLMTVLMQAWQGAAMTERAAEAATDHNAGTEQIVAHSIAARLTSEQTGQQTIAAVEQSLGLRHFEVGSVSGRMARDLSVYMRQVARDEFLQRAAQQALNHEGQIWGIYQ